MRLALLTLTLALFAAPAFADADPQLTIRGSEGVAIFARAELLKRPDIVTLTVAADPAYPGKSMTYQAVPAAALFKNVQLADDAVIQFKCLDGFSAPISKDRLLNQSDAKSRAYVAIETASAPWPPLKPGGPSAGPFYLVWANPELSAVGNEEWPYQLAAFEVKGSLAAVYPKILPDPKLKPNSAEALGFRVFTKNCFACHTLNKSGAAEIGPDLNVPMNPTEYFSPAALRQLIRDPQSVRYFPKARMKGFTAEQISDKDLSNLLAYLKHMTKRR